MSEFDAFFEGIESSGLVAPEPTDRLRLRDWLRSVLQGMKIPPWIEVKARIFSLLKDRPKGSARWDKETILAIYCHLAPDARSFRFEAEKQLQGMLLPLIALGYEGHCVRCGEEQGIRYFGDAVICVDAAACAQRHERIKATSEERRANLEQRHARIMDLAQECIPPENQPAHPLLPSMSGHTDLVPVPFSIAKPAFLRVLEKQKLLLDLCDEYYEYSQTPPISVPWSSEFVPASLGGRQACKEHLALRQNIPVYAEKIRALCAFMKNGVVRYGFVSPPGCVLCSVEEVAWLGLAKVTETPVVEKHEQEVSSLVFNLIRFEPGLSFKELSGKLPEVADKSIREALSVLRRTNKIEFRYSGSTRRYYEFELSKAQFLTVVSELGSVDAYSICMRLSPPLTVRSANAIRDALVREKKIKVFRVRDGRETYSLT